MYKKSDIRNETMDSQAFISALEETLAIAEKDLYIMLTVDHPRPFGPDLITEIAHEEQVIKDIYALLTEERRKMIIEEFKNLRM